MSFSYPIALLIGYIAYCEYREQQSERATKTGEIFYLKNIPFKIRLIVYVCDVLFLIYNYLTQFDSMPMALIVMITLNGVLNLTRISVDSKGVRIGNTMILKDAFTKFQFIPFNEKQDKFAFTFLVRQRPISKETFIKKSERDSLESALNRMKG